MLALVQSSGGVGGVACRAPDVAPPAQIGVVLLLFTSKTTEQPMQSIAGLLCEAETVEPAIALLVVLSSPVEQPSS